VTGRLKDLIIIAGHNHYPHQPASGPAEPAAGAPGKRQRGDPAEIHKVIRRAIAEAHEPSIRSIELLKAGTMPKTTSGKIQRRECKRLFLNHTLEKLGE
jgi:acyl-CoA synthetase (AMP-forming)/AMP-acid ligase II